MREGGLLVGGRIHEVVGLAVVIEVGHGLLVDVDVLHAISRVAGQFGDGSGPHVLDFDLGDHLPHCGLVEEDVDNLVQIAFVEEVIARAQFGDINHEKNLL